MDEERFFETKIRVRFCEVDAYGVVWHGHYAAWFEVARGELAERFGLATAALLDRGYLLPIVSLRIDYKKPVLPSDRLTIGVRLQERKGAMFVCDYKVLRQATGELLAKGETHQVVLNEERELLVSLPRILREAARRIRRYHRKEID